MRYVTSVERLATERGMQQGVQLGLLQGEQNLLLRLLTKRFGSLTEQLNNKIRQANLEQLELWSERILTASSIKEVFDNTDNG
ncbi:DUF4351 domain-containing protein [Candidatus Albibeggiatoa sp. nov. BB20]|uniref:DUF4351 domain-containing protein n=1 Tax=Candidatus Albibeggiatoa sp. nov. BB20 TaxID=3162723 RepID=UPI0033653839